QPAADGEGAGAAAADGERSVSILGDGDGAADGVVRARHLRQFLAAEVDGGADVAVVVGDVDLAEGGLERLRLEVGVDAGGAAGRALEHAFEDAARRRVEVDVDAAGGDLELPALVFDVAFDAAEGADL